VIKYYYTLWLQRWFGRILCGYRLWQMQRLW